MKKKVIRLTESDLTNLVRRIIKESKPKRKINEGIGTALLVLTGVGLFYLGSKIKKFIDKTAKYIPSGVLGSFLSKIKSIEDGEQEGRVVVKERGKYKFIAIIIDGKIFDSMTVDLENDEIYSGHSTEPKWSDKIIPMELPADADREDIDKIKILEDDLINGILNVIAKYGKPKE